MNDGIIDSLKKNLEDSKIPAVEIEKMEDTGMKLVEKLSDPANTSGLLYGRVQSGKTNNMIMSIAVLIERGGFKFFIVLTSDNKSLYAQTLSRIRSYLRRVSVIDYWDIINGNTSSESVKQMIAHDGAVIVSTKNSKNLTKLNEFLKNISNEAGRVVIFDDEADFGSLNAKQNMKKESAVYSQIEQLQSTFNETRFIEVTATPQANLLQKPDSSRHPKFIVQIEPGEGYVSGSELYNLNIEGVPARHHRYIPDEEIGSMLDDNSASPHPPESIYRALCVFFMDGALKSLSSHDLNTFSMLVHISAKKSTNRKLFSLVSQAKQDISRFLLDGTQNDLIDRLMKEAYGDIIRTLEGGANISYDDALKAIADNIDQASVERITSDKGSHNPDYSSFYNILIGGNRLGRGLTVNNLSVFYYARQSGGPKVDTILQHSRVYGYRRKILDIIRIFSTRKMFEILQGVYESDEEEWNYIKSGEYIRTPPVLLSLRGGGALRPTRQAVIPMNSTVKYFPGKTYFMYEAKSSNVEKIDKLLSGIPESNREPVEVDLDTALKAVELVDTYRQEQRWSKDAVRNALKNMSDRGMRIYMVVRRGSDLRKDYRAVLSESDNQIQRSDGPILFMYRTSGMGEGWNGEQAWIPVLRIPEGANAYYFAEQKSVGEESGEE